MFYFLFLNWPLVTFVIHIISFPFRRKLPALSPLSPHFPSFSPSIINLFHHLAWELVFPLRQHVILPTHNIKQCPCTAITLRLCPLPAHSSQRFSSLQIKELFCSFLLAPHSHFPSGFPRHVSFRVKGCCSFTKIYSFSICHFCLFHSHLLVYVKYLFSPYVRNRRKEGRNRGQMDGWMDEFMESRHWCVDEYMPRLKSMWDTRCKRTREDKNKKA